MMMHKKIKEQTNLKRGFSRPLHSIIYPIADSRWVSHVHCVRKEVLLLCLMRITSLFLKG
jgi:hypothetical protein